MRVFDSRPPRELLKYSVDRRSDERERGDNFGLERGMATTYDGFLPLSGHFSASLNCIKSDWRLVGRIEWGFFEVKGRPVG